MAQARLNVPPAAVALLLSPKARAPLNCPCPVAVAPWPLAIAKLVPVLEQVAPPDPDPAVTPLIDAHVAPAGPAPHNAAAAKPEAIAPSRIPPASLLLEMSKSMPHPLFGGTI